MNTMTIAITPKASGNSSRVRIRFEASRSS